MTLALIATLPFIGALLPGLLIRAGRDACALTTGAVTLLAFTLLMTQAPAIFAGEVIYARWEWLPALGLNVTFFLDGLGFFFAGLILGIGLLIITYARYYLSKEDPMGQFYVFLLLFQGAMVGIVLSDNVLLLLIFWELTSLSSFLLIGYWKHLPEGRQGARMALAVTGLGGLAMIGGMLILGNLVGSYDLSVILQHGDEIRASDWYMPALLLILAGCFTKSAQFPFHFWLPHAMAAPTPVSAYLHSRHHGEGRPVSHGPHVARLGRHRRLVLHRRQHRPRDHGDRRLDCAVQRRPQRPARPLHGKPSRSGHDAAWLRDAHGGDRRDLSHHQPRDL